MKNSQEGNGAMCTLPRVVVVGLASCFGCQIQVTNIESHLMEVLGQIDVRYWQLTTSEPMPSDFDVAIIEGAVTTTEARDTVRALRERASVVIALGACATTAGIPGMAAAHFAERGAQVYDSLPAVCENMISPMPVSEVIDVDFEVRGCPIDALDFVAVLQKALYGSNRCARTATLCGECRHNETECFFDLGKLCLGLVTRSGCNAKCPSLGRPCNGCRGLSPDANLDTAREMCVQAGIAVADFDKALEMFNQIQLTQNKDESGATSAAGK